MSVEHSSNEDDLSGDHDKTLALLGSSDSGHVRRLRLTGVDGAAARISWKSTGDRCSIGSHHSNDVVIDDMTVSRFHCEIIVDSRGPRLRDLESMNGTVVDGTRILDCLLRGGALIRIGRSTLRFELGATQNKLPVSKLTAFGRLVGRSVAMRTTFAILERAAATDFTVLLDGETGTGKQVAAEAIHENSARAKGPLITVDCGSLPSNLLESELFGHERGAFTGAGEQRIGAFEEANAGTLFLDEVGELPLDLQPKLLRALEARAIRRVGSNRYLPIDVRVIAATNRDLRREVNGGRFREDLYFRLAVVPIHLPPLRERHEDIPLLVEALLDQMAVSPELSAKLKSDEMLDRINTNAWPGNVRELRNFLQRSMVIEAPVGAQAQTQSESLNIDVDVNNTWPEERARVVARFERAYLTELLSRHNNVVARAAAAAGLDRVYLYKLLRRYDLTPKRR